MTNNELVYRTGFGDQAFEIVCNNTDAYNIAEFLFLDFLGTTLATNTTCYKVILSKSGSTWSLFNDESCLYSGTSRYQLAYTLMNEVIFHCINTNTSQHALHAGAVFKDDMCILLPGNSGKGKSTLTAWLISSGFQYLTDELVFISDNGHLTPLTRPISLKVDASHYSWPLPAKYDGEIISSEEGSMIPHRFLNPDFTAKQPTVTHILFPDFQGDAKLVFDEITPARSCLHLIQSHVNARNLPDHGVPALANVVKKCKTYKLTYGSFDDLAPVFHERLFD
jgi:hypothetical protein